MPSALAHRGPNTVRLAKRFFWKECRRMGVLTEGVFLLAMTLMTLVWWLTPSGVDPAGPLSVIAVGGGMMLAVAAAVTLFSVEKEEGTAEFLERLPRNVVAMTMGKIGAALVLVPLNTLSLLLFAFAIGGDFADAQQIPTEMASRVAIFLAEAFVWSLVASLACPNPLVAAVLGIAMASVSVQLAIVIHDPNANSYTAGAYAQASFARLATLTVGALAAGWLASRWPAPMRRQRATPQAKESDRGGVRPRRVGRPLGLFGRLFWQTLRQSWATALVATLLGLFLTFMGVLLAAGLLPLTHGWQFVLGFGALLAPALLGAVVFRADQRRDAYRFLAEHVGRPRTLWLARNTAGLAMLAVLIAALLAAFGCLTASDLLGMTNRGWAYVSAGSELMWARLGFVELWRTLFVAASASLAAYALGQFFSLTVRSDVIAAMLAIIASALVAGWAMVVWAWRLPPTTFLLPVAVGALLASLLRVRDWMFDRHGWWRWTAPLAVLVAPAAWLVWATPAQRIAQVAAPPPGICAYGVGNLSFDQRVDQTREQIATGREVAYAYERLEAEAVTYEQVDADASDEFSFDGFEGASVPKPVGGRLDGEALAEFLRLSRINCRLMPAPTPYGWQSIPATDLPAVALMETPDKPIDLDGRLERLLACRRVAVQQTNAATPWKGGNVYIVFTYLAKEFVDWATTEGQTSERILKAIQGIREAERMLQGPVGLLMNDRLQAKAVLTGKTVPGFLQQKNAHPSGAQWLAYLAHQSFGFEQERALKALDVLAAYDAAYLNTGVDRIYNSETPDLAWLQQQVIDPAQLVTSLPYQAHNRAGSYLDKLHQLADARTSYLASMSYDDPWRLSQMQRDCVAGDAWRRAERVRLALIAYRLDHDAYPDKLEALAPDYCHAVELCDPYTNEAFGWAPEGFELPVANHNESLGLREPPAPGTPMLWCGGIPMAAPDEGLAVYEDDGALRILQPHPALDAAFSNNVVAPEDSEPLVPAMFLREAATTYQSGAFWMVVPE